MDSANIAPALEQLKPEPSLLLMEQGSIDEAHSCIWAVFGSLIAEFNASVPEKLLVQEDVGWWKQDRAKRLGMSIEELLEKKGGENAWQDAKKGFKKIERFLREHKQDEGPFAMGSRPSYADFVLLAFVEMARRFMVEDDLERFMSQVEGLKAFHEAGKPWCETK